MSSDIKTIPMTLEQAIAECRRIWPGKGHARYVRQWRGDEIAGPDGKKIPKGPIFAFQIGFYRPTMVGRRTPYTIKGQAPDCFERAFKNGSVACRGLGAYERIKTWEQWEG